MLSLPGNRVRYCNGISRRSFFRIGAAGIGGLTLTNLLQAEDVAGNARRSTGKAIINIHLGGGPPHLDLFDMKPDAPREFRGEFNPIATNVPGMDICELFPKLATLADKFSIIRTLVGSAGEHDSYQTGSGWSSTDLKSAGGRPSIGSVASKVIGSLDGKAPPYVDFHTRDGRPGYLGPTFSSYTANPYAEENWNLRLPRTMTFDHLDKRVELLHKLDRSTERVHQTPSMHALDTFSQRAIDIVKSSKVADALDLKREDPRLIARYKGEHPSDNARAQIMAQHNERLLLARRLIEAGVRCVSLEWGGWDTHTDNFTTLRPQLPKMDIGLSALIEDLTARGLFEDVMVVVWGEFRRTPRVNNQNGGRDHWPQVGCGMVFGGGLKGGRVVGSTNRLGEYATDRPVDFQEVVATIYHQLGIDPESTQLVDLNGRPHYLVDKRTLVRELV